MAETIIADISQTTFNREVLKVINDSARQPFYKWKATLVANNIKVNVFYFNAMNNSRDYVNQYTDAICLDLVLNDQEYQRLVVPNRNQLKIRIFKEPAAALTGNQVPGKIVVQEFIAMLYDNSSAIMESNTLMNSNSNVGQKAQLVTVRFFLLNKTIENLRLRKLGPTYRETLAAECIRGMLHQETTASASIVSEIYNGLDLVEGHNQTIKKQIMIPHGTPVIGEGSVIRQIEEDVGGIYNSGFNYYYQKGYWYLYPPFNTERYNTTKNKTLTIINVPQDRFPGMEKTYRETANQVIVICTGATIHQDNSGSAQKNDGNAVMYVDSSKVFNDFYKMEGDKLIVDAKTNVNKFGINETDRTTSNKEVVIKNKGVSTQYFKEFSKLSLRLGMVVGCKWENADPDLIYPGMPVCFMYLDGDQPRQVYGSVIGSSIIVTAMGQGNGSGRDDRKFSTSVMLSIFIANKINIKPK